MYKFIKKVALSTLILGVAFTSTIPSFAAENATVVLTEEGKEKIFSGFSKEALHIRKGASILEESLAILPKGTFVKGTVYETEVTKENPYGEWIKIKYLDVEGYVSKDFLEEAGKERKVAPVRSNALVSRQWIQKAPAKKVATQEAPVKKVSTQEAPVQKEERISLVQEGKKATYVEEKKVEKTEVAEKPVQEFSQKDNVQSNLSAQEVVEKPVQVEKEVKDSVQPVKENVQEDTVKTPVKENNNEVKTPVKESVTEIKETVKENPVQESVKENTVKEPVKETVKEPIKDQPKENQSGSYTTTMEATAYTATGNRTATGTIPKKGTIAVDPDVIPLGTELYVEGYGSGVAEDTGSAIKGNIIDLYMNSEQEAQKWGRKKVNVTIYNYK